LATALVLVALIIGVSPTTSSSQSKKLRERQKFTRLLEKPRLLVLTLKSALLGREVPFRMILPSAYDVESSARFSTIYLLHGLSGHADNWSQKTQLLSYAAAYRFIIVMPEGGDGWYTDSATVPNDKFESYIINELIPEIDKKYRTQADRDHRMIAGLSMGGYGSIKFGLKYPNLFSVVGSFSGAFDAPMRTKKSGNNWPSIPAVFGAEDSPYRTENNIFDILRGFDQQKLADIPYIYLSCGTEDSFIKINRDFDSLLLERKVPHEFRELPGKHAWDFWDGQVQEFLRIVDRKLEEKHP
jgi:S-formylglutathione hydrolase FrmB